MAPTTSEHGRAGGFFGRWSETTSTDGRGRAVAGWRQGARTERAVKSRK